MVAVTKAREKGCPPDGACCQRACERDIHQERSHRVHVRVYTEYIGLLVCNMGGSRVPEHYAEGTVYILYVLPAYQITKLFCVCDVVNYASAYLGTYVRNKKSRSIRPNETTNSLCR